MEENLAVISFLKAKLVYSEWPVGRSMLLYRINCTCGLNIPQDSAKGWRSALWNIVSVVCRGKLWFNHCSTRTGDLS